jgi:hypothetical protein
LNRITAAPYLDIIDAERNLIANIAAVGPARAKAA